MITIKNNDRGRHFLVFDTLFELDQNPDFQDTMFDAIYIMNASLSETITILQHINPITSQKCCYKPFFVSKQHEGQLGEYSELVDGYIYDINDTETDRITESILANLKETGIQRIVDDLSSSNLLFIRLLRFYISRKKRQLVPVLMEGSNLGYVLPVMSLFYKQGLYKHREYIIFMQTMFEKGYLHATQFINKVYLCPQCMHTHLLYVETCPKCGSSNIKSEEVIHHFRCANISPESAYNYGGQLRCPKCHQQLRHIGVDYDRPSTVYYCKSCTNNFLQPHMKVICTNCKKESTVSALIPNDVVAYEITEKGKHELMSTNVYGSIYTEFYDNYIEYEHFTNRIKLIAQQAQYNNDRSDVSIIQIWLLDAQMATRPIKSEFVSYACEVFPYNNISFANHMLYIKYTEHNDGEHNTEGFNQQLTEVLTKLSAYIQPEEVLCYSRVNLTGENIDDFVNRLSFVPEVPEGYFSYHAPDSDEDLLLKPINDSSLQPTEVHEATGTDSESANCGQATEKKTKKTKKRWLWGLFSLVLLLIIGGGIYYLVISQTTEQANSGVTTQPTTKQDVATDKAIEQDELQEAGVMEEEASDNVAPQRTEVATTEEVTTCASGRHYVVAGAFKNYENAVKQLKLLQRENSNLDFSIYTDGTLYIISPFNSSDWNSCSEFVTGNRSLFPDAWVL